MAKIIANKKGRRTIKLNTNEIISIVREYQNNTNKCSSYEEIRNKLNKIEIYLPEDMPI